MGQNSNDKKTFILQFQADVNVGQPVFNQIRTMLLENNLNPDMIVSDIRYKGFYTDSEGLIQSIPEGQEGTILSSVQGQNPETN